MSIIAPLLLSMQLAFVTTVVLILIATPLAWWLSQTSSRYKPVAQAIVAMPIVLPPTVIGFYLLILLGPHGAIGSWWVQITGSALTFSFSGLVIASCVYSLPFAVQPLQSAFESLPRQTLEFAWTQGASKLDAFFAVAVPMSVRGFIGAAVLAFAHTLGEFGVVLMVGGNIPGKTRVISIAIYDQVETLNYGAAHQMSLLLLVFAFFVLFGMFIINKRWSMR
ncbi:MAG: molybdate ABC transporter permease subunit [Gammaproteobacteria bacterium]|nr:molybdate ABC transporter permease subunit [Gammaproteobacteria bacterium]MBT8110400.1 molybdate ABC transporter permease subunit [Gammaproteobacteria bacterium]NND46422.1 molybdate ABC transporter permease subunit [Woeseiaceae bacterium]NNL45100.1 molybdate ABC transporter permease subunit [Woeseiaceae bacterium]